MRDFNEDDITLVGLVESTLGKPSWINYWKQSITYKWQFNVAENLVKLQANPSLIHQFVYHGWKLHIDHTSVRIVIPRKGFKDDGTNRYRPIRIKEQPKDAVTQEIEQVLTA